MSTHAPELETLFTLISLRTTEPISDIESLDSRKSSLHQAYSDEIGTQKSTADTSAATALMKMAEIINFPDWGHVPLGLQTKFLEKNYSAIVDLLLQIAPAALNQTYTNWQDRLGLRSSSEMVEGRFLDSTLAPGLPRHILAPVKEWNRCAFAEETWVLITENRTTLLTLPRLRGCLALLGKGYAVIRLAQIDKLASAPVFYWGDIDQHGFEILASLRSHLPQTQSCLMDAETLAGCSEETGKEEVEGTLSVDFVTANLTPDEHALWKTCAVSHIRLEQENIPSEFSRPILDQLPRQDDSHNK